jgi:multidrug efflux pump subunit AcrB
MTSLTTILAIAPFLVRGDMGSDLQYPLSVALIGGMILGTLVSVFFIPIFYYEIYRKRK